MRKSLPLVLLLTLSLLACNRQPPAPPAKDVKLTHLEENQKVSSNVLFTGTINTTQVIIKLTYQVGTGPEFDVTSGLNGNEFAFSVGSDKMQEGSNTITIHVYLKNGGTLVGTITLIYDPELPPVAGRDLVVLNDINPFGTFDMGESLLVNANNIQYVKNLVNFTPPDGVRKNSTVVWLDRGHGSGNCTGACPDGSFNEMTTLMETQNLTVEIHDSATGTLTSIPQNVKALFLWLPRENYTVPEINTLKKKAKVWFEDLQKGEVSEVVHEVCIKGLPVWVQATVSLEGEKVIVISNVPDGLLLERYSERFRIECLFKNLKSLGFRLENTHMTDARHLERLVCLLAVVFVWAVKLGERVLIPKKKHGRLARSVFRVGISLLLELFRKPFLALLEGLQLLFPKLVGY